MGSGLSFIDVKCHTKDSTIFSNNMNNKSTETFDIFHIELWISNKEIGIIDSNKQFAGVFQQFSSKKNFNYGW